MTYYFLKAFFLVGIMVMVQALGAHYDSTLVFYAGTVGVIFTAALGTHDMLKILLKQDEPKPQKEKYDSNLDLLRIRLNAQKQSFEYILDNITTSDEIKDPFLRKILKHAKEHGPCDDETITFLMDQELSEEEKFFVLYRAQEFCKRRSAFYARENKNAYLSTFFYAMSKRLEQHSLMQRAGMTLSEDS